MARNGSSIENEIERVLVKRDWLVDTLIPEHHRHPASRIHVFYDEKRKTKDENEWYVKPIREFIDNHLISASFLP